MGLNSAAYDAHIDLPARVPDLLGVPVETVVEIQGGWDYAVFEVNGAWIVRVPRRPEVRAWLRKEIRLLPELAPLLPVPVPAIEHVVAGGDRPFVVYRKLSGTPLDEALDRMTDDAASLGSMIGSFLAALHDVGARSGEAWTGTDAGRWSREQERFCEECDRQVFGLLETEERREVTERFDAIAMASPLTLVHGDLGPDHVLVADGRIAGVIDWSDASVGDPAIDLAWPLHATPPAFANALLDAYASPDLRTQIAHRSRCYFDVAHLHEVLYGLERRDDTLVERALRDFRRALSSSGGAEPLG